MLSDYQSIVDAWAQSGLGNKRCLNASVARTTGVEWGCKAINSVEKVRAHVDPATCTEPRDAWLAHGNGCAGVEAKRGAAMRPAPSLVTVVN